MLAEVRALVPEPRLVDVGDCGIGGLRLGDGGIGHGMHGRLVEPTPRIRRLARLHDRNAAAQRVDTGLVLGELGERHADGWRLGRDRPGAGEGQQCGRPERDQSAPRDDAMSNGH